MQNVLVVAFMGALGGELRGGVCELLPAASCLDEPTLEKQGHPRLRAAEPTLHRPLPSLLESINQFLISSSRHIPCICRSHR